MGIDVNALPPWAQKQIADKLAAKIREKAETAAQEKTSGGGKYHNTPTGRKTQEGAEIRFDSKAEAARFDELMLLLRAGAISDLRLQHEFTLIEAYTTPDGKRVRAERYKADFTYWQNGELVVEDVKSQSTKTKAYEIKKKQLLDKYGIEIREIE